MGGGGGVGVVETREEIGSSREHYRSGEFKMRWTKPHVGRTARDSGWAGARRPFNSLSAPWAPLARGGSGSIRSDPDLLRVTHIFRNGLWIDPFYCAAVAP